MISTATIVGRTHRLMQQNCQDFAIANSPSGHVSFGLALDGCGSKYRDENGTNPSRNEIGAQLLGTYAATFLNKAFKCRKQKTESDEPAIEDIISRLYRACVTYLDCLVMLHPFQDEPERKRFMATRLLCTMVGFVVTAETAVCFWSGDGYLAINDEIITLDSNNYPNYIAYQLLGREQNGRFNTLTVRERNKLERIAVATDGWQSSQLQQLTQPQKSLTLQRWMNVQAKKRGNFEDDAAIAIFYANS